MEGGPGRTASGPALSYRLYSAIPPCPAHSTIYRLCYVSLIAFIHHGFLAVPISPSVSRPLGFPCFLTVFPALDLSVFLYQSVSLTGSAIFQYVFLFLCHLLCLSRCHSQPLCAWETCSVLFPGLGWQLLESGVWVKSFTVPTQ